MLKKLKKHVSNDVSNEKAVIIFTYNCLIISDPARIQTWNLLIRSQILYSVKLRGRRAAKIIIISRRKRLLSNFVELNIKILCAVWIIRIIIYFYIHKKKLKENIIFAFTLFIQPLLT